MASLVSERKCVVMNISETVDFPETDPRPRVPIIVKTGVNTRENGAGTQEPLEGSGPRKTRNDKGKKKRSE